MGINGKKKYSDISDLIDKILNANLPEEEEKLIMQQVKEEIKNIEDIKKYTKII